MSDIDEAEQLKLLRASFDHFEALWDVHLKLTGCVHCAAKELVQLVSQAIEDATLEIRVGGTPIEHGLAVDIWPNKRDGVCIRCAACKAGR